jgi:sulfate adenylyltransferase
MPLIPPHGGGALEPLLLEEPHRSRERARAAALPKLTVSSREKGDLIMLGIGGFTPLAGFMGEADWRGVCDAMRTADGVFWPIPITLSAKAAAAESIGKGAEIALVDPDDGSVLATMTVAEKYRIDRKHECEAVFRTSDSAHPGVQMVMAQGEVNLGGPVRVLSDGGFREKYGALFMTPAETRAEFERLGWKRVAAFQTRNPMHRSHEYLAKVALEVCDGVLVHSLLGHLKPGDIPAEVRTRAIGVLIEKYFRPGSVVQAGYPLDMRYAGPREALLHAVFRQNYGCAYQIVGRDHAGVGSYYGPFDAHRIFDEIPAGALAIEPMRMDVTFWCYRCGGMASGRTCPHGEADRLQVSGTRLRQWLSEGGDVPAEFSRAEVLEVLREYYAGLEGDTPRA